jgi:hypothetical protein
VTRARAAVLLSAALATLVVTAGAAHPPGDGPNQRPTGGTGSWETFRPRGALP